MVKIIKWSSQQVLNTHKHIYTHSLHYSYIFLYILLNIHDVEINHINFCKTQVAT